MRSAIPTLGLLLAISGMAASAQEKQNPAPPAQSSGAPGARPLTIQEAEAIGLKNNPQITIGKLRALVAQQLVRESRSALLPTASLSLTAVDANPGSRM